MAAETHHDTYKSSGNHMPAHLSYLSTSVSKTRANNRSCTVGTEPMVDTLLATQVSKNKWR